MTDFDVYTCWLNYSLITGGRFLWSEKNFHRLPNKLFLIHQYKLFQFVGNHLLVFHFVRIRTGVRCAGCTACWSLSQWKILCGPQLARPTWRISPYLHQESDHHHTYRGETTQHVTPCTNNMYIWKASWSSFIIHILHMQWLSHINDSRWDKIWW